MGIAGNCLIGGLKRMVKIENQTNPTEYWKQKAQLLEIRCARLESELARHKKTSIIELIEKSIKAYLEHKQRPAECVILNRPAWEQAKREMSIAAIPLKVENPNAPDGYTTFHGVRLRVIDDNQKTPRVYVSDEWQRFTFGATYAENND